MPIDVNLQSLINLRERMGAPLATVNLQTNPRQQDEVVLKLNSREKGCN